MKTITLTRAAICAALVLPSVAPLTASFAQSTAAAPDSATEPDKLESIVVTARRRTENLQDVPVAVTAVTADELTTAAVKTLEDINSFAPNIKVSAGRATNSTINAYIRGVGQSDPLWGFEPGVGIYIDDVYIARPQGALLDVYDVDRIEVLRGPQGTLYGKNTIAGAIKYITRDIVGPGTWNVSATGGHYGERDVKAGGSTPLGDHVYVGASVAYLRRDGYGEIVNDGTPRAYNYVGQDVSNKDVLAARGNATIVWGEDSKLRFAADTVQDNSNAAGGQRLNGYLFPQLSGTFDSRTDMPVNRDRFLTDGMSVTYTQSLAASLGLKVVGAYREGKGRQFIDFAELNANLFGVPAQYRDHQATGETQLTWTSGPLKAVGGLYYFSGTACGAYDAALLRLLTSLTKGCVDTKSKAVYADTTWKVTDRINLDAGLRWNQDDKTASVFVAQYLGALPPNQTMFDAAAPLPGFRLLAVQTNYANSRRFSNVSPRLGFDMHFTPNVMGYFSYSRGFKSGGFDMRGNAAANPGTKNGFNSEIADNYEAGIKSTLLDDRLLLDVTLFYTPYKDVQITTQQIELVAGNPTNVTAVLNAGKQLNKGVELESAWRALQRLTLTLNVGYLDSYFEDFLVGCPLPAAPGCVVNATAANRPINAPHWTSSLSGQYHWDFTPGSVRAYLGYQYHTFTKVANTTPSVTDQPGYGVLDAGVSFTTANHHWRVSLDGKNLTDKAYRVAGYDFGGPPQTRANALGGLSQIGFYGPPRTYSGTVTYQF